MPFVHHRNDQHAITRNVRSSAMCQHRAVATQHLHLLFLSVWQAQTLGRKPSSEPLWKASFVVNWTTLDAAPRREFLLSMQAKEMSRCRKKQGSNCTLGGLTRDLGLLRQQERPPPRQSFCGGRQGQRGPLCVVVAHGRAELGANSGCCARLSIGTATGWKCIWRAAPLRWPRTYHSGSV